MPRLPRGWNQYFHPQANRPGSMFSYRPGWRGTGQQPIRRVPVAAYTSKASGVPLTGGQAQGIIPGFPGVTGTVNAPTNADEICALTIPVAGTYTVNWTVALAGTTGPADVNNFLLSQNATVLATSVNAGAPGTYPQAPQVITALAGDVLNIFPNVNATAGSVYTGTIKGASGELTLSVGPQGLANVWYPAQATLSTTTGVLDTSTALVYLGSQGVPTTLVASVFSGNGTVALAVPSMSPGQVLIATWTNGHPGDTAAFNIIGTMDALRTA